MSGGALYFGALLLCNSFDVTITHGLDTYVIQCELCHAYSLGDLLMEASAIGIAVDLWTFLPTAVVSTHVIICSANHMYNISRDKQRGINFAS